MACSRVAAAGQSAAFASLNVPAVLACRLRLVFCLLSCCWGHTTLVGTLCGGTIEREHALWAAFAALLRQMLLLLLLLLLLLSLAKDAYNVPRNARFQCIPSSALDSHVSSIPSESPFPRIFNFTLTDVLPSSTTFPLHVSSPPLPLPRA